jgi:hypothetical protein
MVGGAGSSIQSAHCTVHCTRAGILCSSDVGLYWPKHGEMSYGSKYVSGSSLPGRGSKEETERKPTGKLPFDVH